MKKLLLLPLLFVLTACFPKDRYNMEVFGNIDKNERTVLVPSNSSVDEDTLPLLKLIKKDLRKYNWKILILNTGIGITEKTNNKNTKYYVPKARYRLYINVAHMYVDSIMPRWVHFRYEISMVDNKTGGKVFNITGKAFKEQGIKNLVEKIRKIIK